MNGKRKILNGRGEFDYDYLHDILFFKTKNREYEKSIEIDNMVVDIDKEDFIVGIQIFDASKYFDIPKLFLRVATAWKFQATTDKISDTEIRLEIRLMFRVKVRNKIVQPAPIITQIIRESLPDSKIVCTPCAVK